MSTLLPPLRRKDVWNFDLDRKIFVEIVHWGVDCGGASTNPRNNGKGTWNYYIILWERHLPPDIFKGVIEAALGVEQMVVVATNLDSPVSFDLA